MSQFVLLPFEHAFSGASSKPHAQARLTVGGKSRNFVLKLHDGLLFFKEPGRAPVYAVTELLNDELKRDSIGLISRWQREVEALNFGAFVTKRDYFPKLPVRAQVLLIFKPDGSGWMREHFDVAWFLLPEEDAEPLDVWNEKEVETAARKRLPSVQRRLINRAISQEVLDAEPPRFLLESGEQIAEIVSAAARLFIPPDFYWNTPEHRFIKLKSHSSFSKGDIEGAWLKHALHNPHFARVWELLEPRIQFVGVKWSEGGEQVEQYGRSRNEKIFAQGLEKWGQMWRGNWAPSRASFRIDVPDVSNSTQHEKRDAGLVLREWLNGKMGEREIEALLKLS